MYPYSHLEEFVEKIYRRHHITRPSQLNMFWLADQLDIGLYFAGGESESLYWEGRHFIFLDRSLTRQRQWQDFGHEVCHVLMHEGYQRRMYELFRELQEWQADNFMYHFCVPTFMLRDLVLPDTIPEAVQLISHTFQVEVAFAETRLDRYLRKLYPDGFQAADRNDQAYPEGGILNGQY